VRQALLPRQLAASPAQSRVALPLISDVPDFVTGCLWLSSVQEILNLNNIPSSKADSVDTAGVSGKFNPQRFSQEILPVSPTTF
jgi:hypothetical protein